MSEDSGNAGGVLTKAPLAGAYPASAAIALLGLCPFIILTTASALFEQDVIASLHTTVFLATLSNALANAGYAFGAVTAADLVMRIPQRWMFIGCEAVFTAGALIAATSGGATQFILGRVLTGFTTGMLLVVGLPPLIVNYSAKKFPVGAMIINLGLFGMVTLGPAAGGIAASWHGWRLLYLAIAGLGALGMIVGILAYQHQPAPSPGIGFDPTAIPLALLGTFLPFFGVTWLSRGGYLSLGFLAPFVLGIGCLLLLVALQFFREEALMPVAPITDTLPVVGIGVAMIGGAAFTVLLELQVNYLLHTIGRTPAVTGGLLSPMLVGLAVAAVAFKRIVVTRWLALLTLGGLVAVSAAAAMMLGLGAGDYIWLVPLMAVLMGFGAGAAVAPGLFMGGLSTPASQLGETFALVELLRSEAAFILAPIMSYVAISSVSPHIAGIHLAAGVTFGLLTIAGVGLTGILLAGGIGPHAPDIEEWLTSGENPAYHSPPIAAPVRNLL